MLYRCDSALAQKIPLPPDCAFTVHCLNTEREEGKTFFFLRFPASSSKTFSASAFPGRGGNILLQSFSERKAREKKKRVNSTARGMPESCYLVVAE